MIVTLLMFYYLIQVGPYFPYQFPPKRTLPGSGNVGTHSNHKLMKHQAAVDCTWHRGSFRIPILVTNPQAVTSDKGKIPFKINYWEVPMSKKTHFRAPKKKPCLLSKYDELDPYTKSLKPSLSGSVSLT